MQNDQSNPESLSDVAPLALRIPQVARAAGVSPRTIRAVIRNGELKSIVIGRRCRAVLRSDLEEYLRSRRQ